MVERAAARAGSEGVAFRKALIDSEGLGLTLAEIDALLDPAAGLESAAALVDHVLDGGRGAEVRDDPIERGMSVRREVLGDAHVDASRRVRVRGDRRVRRADHALRVGRDLGAAGP